MVGEDLGTIEDEVRDTLVDRRLLSCRVLWFEEPPPAEWPERAMATVTTHDLPTLAGVWSGDDEHARLAAGLAEDPGANDWFRSRVTQATGLDETADVRAAVVATHAALAATPALVRLAAVDDACVAPERPNLPGTIDEHPNWRLPLPLTLEQLMVDPTALAVAEALGTDRRRPDAPAAAEGAASLTAPIEAPEPDPRPAPDPPHQMRPGPARSRAGRNRCAERPTCRAAPPRRSRR